MSEQKMSFRGYMQQIQKEGLEFEGESFAASNAIKAAVSVYGEASVRKVVSVMMPEIIERSCKNYMEMSRCSSKSVGYFYMNVAERFKENYENGRGVKVGPFILVKKNKDGVIYPEYLREKTVSEDGR